jgi:hypothetical protein
MSSSHPERPESDNPTLPVLCKTGQSWIARGRIRPRWSPSRLSRFLKVVFYPAWPASLLPISRREITGGLVGHQKAQGFPFECPGVFPKMRTSIASGFCGISDEKVWARKIPTPPDTYMRVLYARSRWRRLVSQTISLSAHCLIVLALSRWCELDQLTERNRTKYGTRNAPQGTQSWNQQPELGLWRGI